MQRYAITDRTLLPPHPGGISAALAEHAARWADAGIDFVQLREKDLTQTSLETLTRLLAAAIQKHSTHTRLLISGLTANYALASGAHGIHLPGPVDAAAIQQARQQGALVSVSCHTLLDIASAREAGIILWAPVFGKQIPGHAALPGTGLTALAQACRAAFPVPVFALGGITPANAQRCIDAGAAGIAGIRLFHGDSRFDFKKSNRLA